MARVLVVVLLAGLPAAAAPLPEESDFVKAQRAYGLWHDPHGDTGFRLAGPDLRVRMSGEPRDFLEYSAAAGKAPMFLREVEGDFTLTVRVTLPHLTDDELGERGAVAAGLTAVDATGNRIGVRRAEKRSGATRAVMCYAYHNAVTRSGGGGTGGMKGAEGPTYLRLARAGANVTTSWSPDGQDWKAYGNAQAGVAWNESIKVGLVAENTTGGPVTITFDRYALERAKK